MSFLHLLSAQLCQWSTSALRPARLLRRLHQLWLKGVIHPSTDLCLYMMDTIEEINVNGFLMNIITFMPTIPQCVEIYQLCWL